MTNPRNPYARTVSVTLTDIELLALTHALDKARDANAEWAKCERLDLEGPAEEARLLAEGDAVLARLREAYKPAKPRVAVRVTCSNGNTWTTEMNGTLADARRYYLGQTFTDECQETGRETRNTVVSVVELEGGSR